jgi:antitoxin (DNA-binding transcriptional repressor) of toxin-antitoxin stability system
MARYSVATTKDNLSSLIDKALAGEEVIITRHGKPTVEMIAVNQSEPLTLTQHARNRVQPRS